LVYGPDITLGKGKYQIKFFLRFDEIKAGKDLAILDITADYGRVQLSKKIVHANEVNNGV